jgi:hypothetical protein
VKAPRYVGAQAKPGDVLRTECGSRLGAMRDIATIDGELRLEVGCGSCRAATGSQGGRLNLGRSRGGFLAARTDGSWGWRRRLSR